MKLRLFQLISLIWCTNSLFFPVNLYKGSTRTSNRYSSISNDILPILSNSDQSPAYEQKPLLSEPIRNSEYIISDKDCLNFMRNGHIFLPGVVDKRNIPVIENLRNDIAEIFTTDNEIKLAAYRHKARVSLGRLDSDSMSLEECEKELSKIDSEDIPFMQVFNIWRNSQSARNIALSPILGKIAADLLGVDSVRLYQDSIFMKRPGDGPTMWHSDLNMCPFDTNDFVTCWIPLQEVPSEEDGGSGLTFASGSHRDFALAYWNDIESADFSDRYDVKTYNGYKVGDCSFHHGWCLHSAPGNSLSETRYAYSISFVVDGAPILREEGHIRYPDNEDYQSYADWIEDIGWGGHADHPLIPVVYSTHINLENL